MAADDVYLAMLALEDDGVLGQLSKGDWSPLEYLPLSADEVALVRAVVDSADDDVVGFGGSPQLFAVMNYTSGKLTPRLLATKPPLGRFTRGWSPQGIACGGCHGCTGCAMG